MGMLLSIKVSIKGNGYIFKGSNSFKIILPTYWKAVNYNRKGIAPLILGIWYTWHNFSAILYKGDNFCDFLFAFQHIKHQSFSEGFYS